MKHGRSPFALALALVSVLPACHDTEPAKGEKKTAATTASSTLATTPATAMAAAAPASTICAQGGGDVKDAISAPFFPKSAGGFCIDPMGEARTYGDRGKLPLKDVCTTSFDGECEWYLSFALKRYVGMRYVDGSGKPNVVDVGLSQFATPEGAYAMFTKRVIAGGDPANGTTKPLIGGAVTAVGKSNAYVCKGPYLVELAFSSDDTKITLEEIEKLTGVAVTAIAKGIGDKLPGSNDLVAAAKSLPSTDMVPLGISFLIPGPKASASDPPANGALGMPTFFPAAIGYYKTGPKRYRLETVQKDDADRAADLWKPLRAKAGVLPVANLGDDGVHVVVQDSPQAVKTECVAARKGAGIYAVCDEEQALSPGDSKEQSAAVCLTKEEKLAHLRDWLATQKKPEANATKAGGAAK